MMLCHGMTGREGMMVYFIIKIKACNNNRLLKNTLISLIIVS